MGSSHTHPGHRGHHRCPLHPSEPVIGLCGCGAFFCRLCSPSAVFCQRCHSEHLHWPSRTQVYAARVANPGWEGLADGHRHARTFFGRLSRRVIIEALLLTALATIIITLIAGGLNRELSFSSAEAVTNYGTNPESEPVQLETGFFQATLPVDGGVATVSSDASYSISAKVEGIKAYEDASSPAVPYDLLLAWGKMADVSVDGRLTWKQQDRQGVVSGSLGGANGADVSHSYVVSHVSNNHLIPANERIRTALETIKTGDLVKIDGHLVDVKIKTGNRIVSLGTSKSRTDQGDGACEVIFVEQIRINNRYYQ